MAGADEMSFSIRTDGKQEHRGKSAGCLFVKEFVQPVQRLRRRVASTEQQLKAAEQHRAHERSGDAFTRNIRKDADHLTGFHHLEVIKIAADVAGRLGKSVQAEVIELRNLARTNTA